MKESVSKGLYEHKVRVRVCGVLVEGSKILLLRHDGVGTAGYIWSPPGGGLDFYENAHSTLVKEFMEETNLLVEVDRFLFVNEYHDDRYHAIELFFLVKKVGGQEKLGFDPEVPKDEQILTEMRWMDFEELKNIPKANLHNIFNELDHPSMIVESSGFYKFGSISKK